MMNRVLVRVSLQFLYRGWVGKSWVIGAQWHLFFLECFSWLSSTCLLRMLIIMRSFIPHILLNLSIFWSPHHVVLQSHNGPGQSRVDRVTPVPATAAFTTFDGTTEWKPVIVVDYLEESNTYLVQWSDTGQTAWVPRQYSQAFCTPLISNMSFCLFSWKTPFLAPWAGQDVWLDIHSLSSILMIPMPVLPRFCALFAPLCPMWSACWFMIWLHPSGTVSLFLQSYFFSPVLQWWSNGLSMRSLWHLVGRTFLPKNSQGPKFPVS